MDKNRAQVLVCLFNEKVQESLSFLQEVENLISVDRLKATDEIIYYLYLILVLIVAEVILVVRV